MYIVTESDGTKLKYSYGEVELYKLPPKASGDIVIPQRVTFIRKRKLTNKNITSITLQGKVKKLALGAFDACTDLEKILVTPANQHFENDRSGVLFTKGRQTLVRAPQKLDSVYVMPNGVKYIEKYAFKDCQQLTTLIIASTVRLIDRGSFQNCTAMSHLIIPAGVAELDTSAFDGCTRLGGLTVAEENDTFMSDKYGVLFSKDQTELLFMPPAFVGSYCVPEGVTHIADRAFANCTELTGVRFPKSLCTMGEYVFQNCTNLEVVQFDGELEEILTGTFENCVNLSAVGLSEHIRYIYGGVFNNCHSLIGFHVAPNNTVFSTDAYDALLNHDQTELFMVPPALHGRYVVPDSVTSIGLFAFFQCEHLTEIHLPFNIELPFHFKDWVKKVLKDCKQLQKIRLKDPRGLGYDPETFDITAVWENIEEAEILNGVKKIPQKCFAQKALLKKVFIPKTVTDIGDYAFVRCKNLTDIQVDPQNVWFYTDDKGVLFRKEKGNTWLMRAPTNLSGSYTVPDEVCHILTGAFEGCDQLIEVVAADDMIGIEKFALVDCPNLTRLVIADGRCFFSGSIADNCPNLKVYTPAGTDTEADAKTHAIPYEII